MFALNFYYYQLRPQDVKGLLVYSLDGMLLLMAVNAPPLCEALAL